MKKYFLLLVAFMLSGVISFAQHVTWPPESIIKLTPEWTGERLKDGRPKVSDALLERLKNVSMEEAWAFLRQNGYLNQFENFASMYENGWYILHPDQVMTGRVVTAQFLPSRPDYNNYVQEMGKEDNMSVPVTNFAPINALSEGDIYVADSYGKMFEGTLIGDNLGNAIYNRSKRGVIYNGSLRDAEGLSEIEGFNFWVRGYDPSAIAEMMTAEVNAPIRIGRVTVLPGDVVLAKKYGIIFIPPHLVNDLVLAGEYTALRDKFNFYCIKTGLFKYDNERFVDVTPKEFEKAFLKWINDNPSILPMPREEFDSYYQKRMKKETEDK